MTTQGRNTHSRNGIRTEPDAGPSIATTGPVTAIRPTNHERRPADAPAA
jgi:hypothetical protein